MIKGIIFDLGYTLIHCNADWDTIHHAGAEAMAEWYLKKKHIKLDSAALIETFLAEQDAGRRTAEATQTEVLAQDCLRRALEKIDAPKSAAAFTEAAIKIYFGPEEAAWTTDPAAIDTLKQLQAQNYRLGLYSNASDDAFVQRLVNQHKLRPWLSPTFSSAGCGWRKPRPEPLELIAQRWGIPPAEIVMVGDSLPADILGAHNAGMPSIWVTPTESAANPAHPEIEPAAIVESLAAVPAAIAQL